MKKLENALVALKKASGKFITWLRKNPWHIVIVVNVFLVAVIGLVLFIQVVLPTLLVAGFLVLIFFWDKIVAFLNKPKQLPLPLLESVYGYIMIWAYIVVIRQSPALPSPMRVPTGKAEVYGNPPVVTIGGVKRFQFNIPLSLNNQDIAIDIPDVIEVIQAGFNGAFDEGDKLLEQPTMLDANGIHVPVTTYDGERIVTIADITRERLRLVITAFWVNDSDMAAAVVKWRNDSAGGGFHAINEGGVDVSDCNF